jgi:catechol 2,3-dioxygenase-like lactoylglutathione lyase family enzyme
VTGPAVSAALEGLELMHLGAAVADITASIAMQSALGMGPWAVSVPIDFTSYDGGVDAVVPQRLRLAFGMMPGGLSIELVQPMSDSGPQARLLSSRPGLNHLCYWVHDLSSRGRALLEAGGTIAAASSGAAGEWDRSGRPGGIPGLLDAVPTATFRVGDGLLIELLSVSMWADDGLQSFFGPDIIEAVSAPTR